MQTFAKELEIASIETQLANAVARNVAKVFLPSAHALNALGCQVVWGTLRGFTSN